MKIIRGLYSNDSLPVALTIGNFDGVHLGHQALLNQLRVAANSRQLQTAVIIFEPHPREFFTPLQAPARLTSLREKLYFFSTLNIDRVHICRFNANFAQMTAANFMNVLHEKLSAKFMLIGDDFRFGSGRNGDYALIQKIGLSLNFEVQAVETVMHDSVRISSTAIRSAIAAGQMRTAQRYLGRHFSISGKVVTGSQVGHQIGFPTANIRLKHNLTPLTGIYVVQAHVEGYGILQGVASIGVRPTIAQNGKPLLEVHLFEFCQKIYGKHLRVDFMQKLRDEEKYLDLETLRRHIALDVEHAKKWFKQHD